MIGTASDWTLKAAAWILAAVLAGGSAQAAAPAMPPADPALSIGFVGTLTGARAHVAQDRLDGFKLGVKHAGGRIGGQEFNLTAIDDKDNAATALRAAKRLLDQTGVRILLWASDTPAPAALPPLATRSGTLLLALGSPSPALAGSGCNPLFFSLASLDETEHETTGRLLQKQGYPSLAVAGPDSDATRQAVAALKKTYHGAVVLVTSRKGRMSFREELARIRDIAPGAVYLLHSGGMAVNFIIQYQKAGLKERTPLFAPADIADRTVIAAAGPAAANLFSVAPWSDDMDTPSNRRMMADFEVEYGRPASIDAAYGYDAAMMLDRAIAAAGIRDREALRQAMLRADFPATREAFRFGSNQFPVETFLLRQVVEDQGRGRLGNEQQGVVARAVGNGAANACPMRGSAPATPVKP